MPASIQVISGPHAARVEVTSHLVSALPDRPVAVAVASAVVYVLIRGELRGQVEDALRDRATFLTHRPLHVESDPSTGGLVLEMGFSRPVDLEEVRGALSAGGLEDFQVRTYGTAREVEVRLPPARTGAAMEEQKRVQAALAELDPEVKVNRTESVGPQVSEQLGNQAALAFEKFFGVAPPREYDGELRAMLSA